MFTGIVEELGTVISLKRGSKAAVLTIKANVIFEDLKLGDSVAVNGVCLTATHISGNTFQADVMNETFNRSSLGSLKKGSVVNLERAMAANGRFGGHMVAGHVDDTGELVSVKQDDNAVWFTIKAPENIMKYCIEKGSIALDGISLTIAKLSDDTISVSMIPHTIKNTNFGYKKPGDKINLENDMVGKYIDKLLHFDQQETNDKHTNSTLTKYGAFEAHEYVDQRSGEHHVALVKGDIADGEPVLCRVHSECLTGDTFGSLRCDCGEQRSRAMRQIEKEGRGVFLYMRQEGRGIGLINKLKAYVLQEQGMDTVEANLALGFKDDERDYSAGAMILQDLGIKKLRLMTNNPTKIDGLNEYGLEIVERVPIQMPINPFDKYYMQTKQKKMGHMTTYEV